MQLRALPSSAEQEAPPRLGRKESFRKMMSIQSKRTQQRENDALIGRLRGLLRIESDDPALTTAAADAGRQQKPFVAKNRR